VLERVFVVALLRISILFLLVVLISLLRGSLKANGRIEDSSRHIHEVRKTDVEYLDFTFNRNWKESLRGIQHDRASESEFCDRPKTDRRRLSAERSIHLNQILFQKP
jgi:hypothetical protein